MAVTVEISSFSRIVTPSQLPFAIRLLLRHCLLYTSTHAIITARAKQAQGDYEANLKHRDLAKEIGSSTALTKSLVDTLINKVYVFRDERIEIDYAVRDFFENEAAQMCIRDSGKRAVKEIGGTRSRLKDESEWIKIPDHHPAIVSMELYEQANACLLYTSICRGSMPRS